MHKSGECRCSYCARVKDTSDNIPRYDKHKELLTHIKLPVQMLVLYAIFKDELSCTNENDIHYKFMITSSDFM